MRRKRSKLVRKIIRVLLTASAIVLISGTLSGCAGASAIYDLIGNSYNDRDFLTATQQRNLLFAEITSIIIILLVIALLIVLYLRYRKTLRTALETEMRERELLADNMMLDRINHMKTEFFQNMSHDFKTPLTVISTSVLNALDLLDYEMDTNEMQESLRLAQNEIMRMARIVDSASKHSAMYDNRQSMEPVDMILLLRNVAGIYRALLDRRGNTMKLTVPQSLPYVYGNADMLLNVLSNLISNANRFTRNGEVTLSARLIYAQVPVSTDEPDKKTDDKERPVSTRRYVSITVGDNGEGIDPEILPNIFKRGITYGGSGLGLSIIKTAVEAHSGTITIESIYTVGTNVTFTVPVYEKSLKTQQN